MLAFQNGSMSFVGILLLSRLWIRLWMLLNHNIALGFDMLSHWARLLLLNIFLLLYLVRRYIGCSISWMWSSTIIVFIRIWLEFLAITNYSFSKTWRRIHWCTSFSSRRIRSYWFVRYCLTGWLLNLVTQQILHKTWRMLKGRTWICTKHFWSIS